jgi:hypothetical protein
MSINGMTSFGETEEQLKNSPEILALGEVWHAKDIKDFATQICISVRPTGWKKVWRLPTENELLSFQKRGDSRFGTEFVWTGEDVRTNYREPVKLRVVNMSTGERLVKSSSYGVEGYLILAPVEIWF